MSRAHAFAQVLLDTSLPQLDHLFDYEVPDGLHDRVQIGQRVRVPLRAGARQSFGYIISLSESSSFSGKVSSITDLVSEVPVLTPKIALLARTLADRAAGSASDILRLAIPPRQVRAEKAFINQHGMPGTLVLDPSSSREPTRETIFAPPHPTRLPTGEWVPGWTTLVADLSERSISNEESVIIVVPDQYDVEFIADTLRARDQQLSVIRVDAQQSNSTRYTNFLTVLGGGSHVIIGNRSAVYAPTQNLGAIIVVDDGDSLLEEPLSPYVHARDAALVRSDLERTDLYFVANSRSLEVHRLVALGYIKPGAAAQRASSIVLTERVSAERSGQRVPALALDTIRSALRDGPVLVQVPSPGFAAATFCASCSQRQRCGKCGGPLEIVSQPATSKCRWCLDSTINHGCAACGGHTFRHVGAGSVRTAEEFSRQFPETRVLSSDGDNRRVLIDSRPGIVVATRGAEPLAAGGYSAVILLDADRMLSAPALRAEEEALRVWMNAASLARPGGKIILTEASGLLASSFALGTLEKWLDFVLAERKALRYPPAVRAATVSGPASAVHAAVESLTGISGYDVIQGVSESAGIEEVVVRFDYTSGHEIAIALRQALIANATVSRSRTRERYVTRVQTALRLHFDDAQAFDERRGRNVGRGRTISDTEQVHPTDPVE